MEVANSLRFRNALVFLRHQLRSTNAVSYARQQRRRNTNIAGDKISKAFSEKCVPKFFNKGMGELHSVQNPIKGLFNTLRERGFVNQFHGHESDFVDVSDKEVLQIYAGADATAKSLHLGHLMFIMPMIHCMLHGHHISFLIGNATARIGDPSGRTTEREGMRDADLGERVLSRSRAIHSQLSTLLSNATSHAIRKGYNKSTFGHPEILDNLSWHQNVTLIDYFQLIGSRARIGEMMLRKSVSERMKSEEGISYGEFSYQLIQAIDYWHLFSSRGCRLQIGGSDQWGNITAGCDLINKMVNEATWVREYEDPELVRKTAKPFGLTVPLLTQPNGEKISKSTGGGNIWLSEKSTPPFNLYQFLISRPDESMEDWLRYFTILKIEDIAEIMKMHNLEPEKRYAQRTLAHEIISLVHGPSVADQCVQTTAVFFGQSFGDDAVKSNAENKLQQGLDLSDIQGVSHHSFWTPVLRSEIVDQPLEKILVQGGLAPSNNQARTLMKSGGLRMGPHLAKVLTHKPIKLHSSNIIEGEMPTVVFKVGKNNIHVVRIVNDEATLNDILLKRGTS